MENVVTITRNPILDFACLPPHAALDALREQLRADTESQATSGVLISWRDVSMVAAFADHGIETVMDLLILCIASATDAEWADNNGDEREVAFDDLTGQMFDDLRLYLDGEIERRLRQRYVPTLLALEQERRDAEAADAKRQPEAGV